MVASECSVYTATRSSGTSAQPYVGAHFGPRALDANVYASDPKYVTNDVSQFSHSTAGFTGEWAQLETPQRLSVHGYKMRLSASRVTPLDVVYLNTSYVLLASNDSLTWSVLDQYFVHGPEQREWQDEVSFASRSIPPSQPHSIFRLVVTSIRDPLTPSRRANARFRLSDVQVLGSPVDFAMPLMVFPQVLPLASGCAKRLPFSPLASSVDESNATLAFYDRSAGKLWTSAQRYVGFNRTDPNNYAGEEETSLIDGRVFGGEWVQFSLPALVTVKAYSFDAVTPTETPIAQPSSWALLGAQSPGGAWDLIHEGNATASVGEQQTFFVSNITSPKRFVSFRLVILRVPVRNFASLADTSAALTHFRVIGAWTEFPSPPPLPSPPPPRPPNPPNPPYPPLPNPKPPAPPPKAPPAPPRPLWPPEPPMYPARPPFPTTPPSPPQPPSPPPDRPPPPPPFFPDRPPRPPQSPLPPAPLPPGVFAPPPPPPPPPPPQYPPHPAWDLSFNIPPGEPSPPYAPRAPRAPPPNAPSWPAPPSPPLAAALRSCPANSVLLAGCTEAIAAACQMYTITSNCPGADAPRMISRDQKLYIVNFVKFWGITSTEFGDGACNSNKYIAVAFEPDIITTVTYPQRIAASTWSVYNETSRGFDAIVQNMRAYSC